MAGLDGVVSVFPNEKRHLLTTKSWDFIGLTQHARRQDYESDIIIGVIDTGIWPESASFNDKVVAAGNHGPHNTSLENFQPWTIVVAASTLDRKFVTKVKLGDNTTYEGISLNTFDLGGKLYPIIYGRDAPNTTAGVPRHISRFCSTNTLDDKLVKGKIVLCEGSEGTIEALRVGAIGVLMKSDSVGDTAMSYPIPACFLQSKDVTNIHNYMSSTRNPMATIYRSNELKDTLAPVVASFSSRGPNHATNEILKVPLLLLTN
ncbi:hypothetical protein TSUD_214300 [Trifolium subterraneum]|uniref:PA domain-containing protein n=1 Tax=Trifolium subterraneum TaxID=3900 RepID=A0A2Z6N2C4_TRISU|nr:hypothetical protein TSUD_214300 [Trifolium subterraneum]